MSYDRVWVHVFDQLSRTGIQFVRHNAYLTASFRCLDGAFDLPSGALKSALKHPEKELAPCQLLLLTCDNPAVTTG